MAKNKSIIKHIPNALTIIFLGLIVYAPKTGQAKPANLLLGAFILFVVTGLTDIVDGYLAHRFEVASKFRQNKI